MIPSLSIKPVKPEHAMLAVINGYRKEVGIQRRWGGIRNPVGVVHNKIRHELTNYDACRDALTLLVDSGRLDMDRAVELRALFLKVMHAFVEEFAGNMKGCISLPYGGKVTAQQIRDYNDRWKSKESDVLNLVAA